MPELDPLPHRPSAPVLRPRTGDFDGVVSRAKHRRRRHTGLAGAGVAGGVAVAAVVLLGHAQVPYGLRPAPPVASIGGHPTGSHATAATKPGAVPGATQPTPGAGGGGAPRGTGATTAAPGDGHGPVVAAPVPAGGGAAGAAARRPVFVRDDVPNDTEVCDTDPSIVTATGWCLRYEGPDVAHLGETYAYRMYACRHVGRGAQTLTFHDEGQVDIRVRNNDRTLWRWSHGWKFPAHRNTVRVADGRCARWTMTWNTVADDRKPIVPGDYSVDVDFDVDDWGNGTYMAVAMGGSVTIAR
jgi:hypothetical protein